MAVRMDQGDHVLSPLKGRLFVTPTGLPVIAVLPVRTLVLLSLSRCVAFARTRLLSRRPKPVLMDFPIRGQWFPAAGLQRRSTRTFAGAN